MKLAGLIRREWPHLVGLQEVYTVKICLDLARTQCLLDQDYLEILLENLNERTESYRSVATITNIDLQNLPATLPTEPLVPFRQHASRGHGRRVGAGALFPGSTGRPGAGTRRAIAAAVRSDAGRCG